MMLSIIFSKKKASSFVSSSDDQGLKTLTKLIPNGGINSNQLVINPIFQINHKSKTPSTTLDDHYCFLNSCHLCHKHLSLNKEIYMYRGDLGFCSLECRDRQIYLDETKEIEISTQKILASFRQRRCEDYRSSRPHPLSSHKSRVIFS